MAISSSDHPRFLPAPDSGGSSKEHYLIITGEQYHRLANSNHDPEWLRQARIGPIEQELMQASRTRQEILEGHPPQSLQQVIDSTFLHPSTARFSNRNLGEAAWYTAADTLTAIHEVSHHLSLAWQNAPAGEDTLYTVYDTIINGHFHDASSNQTYLQALRQNINDYTQSQMLARTIRNNPSIAGIHYHSVRDPRPHMSCLAILRPHCIASISTNLQLRMWWDGRRVQVDTASR